jgi:RNA polymerase sigma factor (sigma-70 family)
MTAPSVSLWETDEGQPSDAELIERSWGEPEAFAVLFDRYAADIHHYAARRLGTGAADDLVAETFLAAFRRRTSYDTARAGARPWLYGIATTLIARQRRSEQRLYRALARTGVDPLPEPMAEVVVRRVAAQQQQRLLAAALAGLPPADRHVLLLVAWGGLSYAAGRHGVAFARVTPGEVGLRIRVELILDPQTFYYLGERSVAANDASAPDGEWEVAKGTVLSASARTSAAIVDRPGQRP